MQPALLSGPRVVLTISGQTIGAGHVMSWRIRTAHEELRGCDSVVPYELMPTAVSVSLTLQVYRKPDDSPVALGLAPAAVPSFTSQAPFSSNRYVTVEVRDTVTDRTTLYLPRCTVVDRSASVQAEDLLVETWQVMSIGAQEAMSNAGPLLGG